MAIPLVRFSSWIGAIILLCLCPLAAQQMGGEKSAQSVTGCLQKGDEAGGFTLTGEDGKVWELHSKKVQLADHVGHTVTLTGVAAKESKPDEEKIEASEKKEAGTKEHDDLRVSSLKMVSDSCK